MQRGSGRPATRDWVAVLCTEPPEHSAFFPPATLQRLEELCEVRLASPDSGIDGFAEALAGVHIAITSWRFPPLSEERLAAAPELRFVMHTGSSVKFLVTDEFWRRGLRISQAGAAMAPAVAELSLAFTLAMLRRLPRLDHALRDGADWYAARSAPRGHEVAGSRIGVVGASRTGRRFVELCLALGADVRVYDPYVEPSDPLESRRLPLDELLAWSDVVTVHAPATEETRGLLSRKRLALLRDGAAVVNTARSSLVDVDALYDEAASGRLDVATDVYETEPLPSEDRWRRLPNVLLTPHLGGATAQSRRRAGEIVVSEIERFIADKPLEHEIVPSSLGRLG